MNSTTYDFTLYDAAIAADAAYQRELVRAYGKNACNRRYQQKPHKDEAVQAARVQMRTTTEAWITEMRKGK